MKDYESAYPLFDRPTATIKPSDPNVLETDRARLSGAARRVLERLKEGPATNLQLLGPECGGTRYGSRLRDLRVAGVIWKKRHVKGAIWEYELISCPEGLS